MTSKLMNVFLEDINTRIKSSTQINQWRNTADAWFKEIPNKSRHTFISFDVIEFYPSISEKLLLSALKFAAGYTTITERDKAIILHTKKSILYNNGQPWGKKTSQNLFDVTMGCFDGAETCELVGAYILYQISKKYKNKFGLYRDDGLGALNATPRQVDNIKKDLCAIFGSHDLRILIEANRKIVNFLDVTLNLENGKYEPYTKPNTTITYVHKDSNHPPNIIKNIPLAINKRLSEISSDGNAFSKAVPIYQEALEKSGYQHKLEFSSPKAIPLKARNRQRKRNTIWYNPPYSNTVHTNIGKTFFKLIDEEFSTDHKLHKIFNRNIIKLSYSCMNNVKQAINSHNQKLLSLNHQETTNPGCNCRNKNTCPLPDNCLAKSVIYQASVTTTDNNKPVTTYVGLTENSFKTRYNLHKSTFNDISKRYSTELSSYIWELKESSTDYNIAWKILSHAKPYSKTAEIANYVVADPFH
ncbi:uncharacterized protein [Watersipora subatra]|uniref:uncharacterized protein n=1 Tax=Watersipora subatra TaxID=2589382 RepID=UPI00355B5DEF